MICSAQTREEDNKDSTKTAAVTSFFCHTNNTAARNVYKAKTFIASVKVGAEKEKSTGLSHLNGIFFSLSLFGERKKKTLSACLVSYCESVFYVSSLKHQYMSKQPQLLHNYYTRINE